MERQSETSVMNQGQYTSTTYMVDMLLLPHCHAHRYLFNAPVHIHVCILMSIMMVLVLLLEHECANVWLDVMVRSKYCHYYPHYYALFAHMSRYVLF